MIQWNVPKILLHKKFLVIFRWLYSYLYFPEISWLDAKRGTIVIVFSHHPLKCSSLLSSSSIAMFSKNYMLMAVAMHLIEEESNTFIHSRYRKEFYTLLSELEKSRRYRRIPRCALPLPRDSPWRRVFFSNSDQADYSYWAWFWHF